MLSLEPHRIFPPVGPFCFVYSKSLNDWPPGGRRIIVMLPMETLVTKESEFFAFLDHVRYQR